MAQAGSPFSGESERLGDLLVEAGLVSESQLKDALRLQSATSEHLPLGELLIQQGLLMRTPRGRVPTVAAWAHLGLVAPASTTPPASEDPPSLFG